MTNELRSEILLLERSLTEKKKRLFMGRLENIAKHQFDKSGVSDVCISLDPEKSTWQISYLHTTDKYDVYDYAYDGSDTEPDIDPNIDPNIETKQEKETRILFGKASKYFIKGGIKLNVYRNTAGELRVINPNYEFELDLDEQRNLVREYSENIHLPEWFAITTMLYLSDNKWDDQSWINHLSIV